MRVAAGGGAGRAAGSPAAGRLWFGTVVVFVFLFVCVCVRACVCVCWGCVCGGAVVSSLFPSFVRRVVFGVSRVGCVWGLPGFGWCVGVCVSNMRVCDGGLFGGVWGLGLTAWPGVRVG